MKLFQNHIILFCLTFLLEVAVNLAEISDSSPYFLVQPQSSAIHSGVRISLRCDFGPVGVNSYWLRNGTVLNQENGISISRFPTHSIATFPSANNELTGSYRCLLNNSIGAIISQPALLTISGSVGPNANGSVPVYKTRALVGNIALIRCNDFQKNSGSSIANSTSVVQFKFNGLKLQKTARHKILPTGNLLINNVTQRDNGQYKCFLIESRNEQKYSTHVSTTELNVSTSFQHTPPRFTWMGPKTMEVVEGDTLTLECVAGGRPIPHVTWIRYGGLLPSGRHSLMLGNLVINNVQKLDEGTYICQAESPAGVQISHVVFVDVLQRPVITKSPLNQNITEGGKVLMTCRASGYPKPTISWFHNAERIVNGSDAILTGTRLTIANVQKTRSGLYQCFASNSVGQSSATARLDVLDRLLQPSRIRIETDIESLSDQPVISTSSPRRSNSGRNNQKSKNNKKAKKKEKPNQESGRTKQKKIQEDQTRILKPAAATTVVMVPPPKPSIKVTSDTSVSLSWSTLANDEGLPIVFLKVQYKEYKNLKRKNRIRWKTIEEDLLPNISSFQVNGLQIGSFYQFRLVAIYSNNDNKHGPTSARVSLSMDGGKPRIPLTAPTIVEVRPLSTTDISVVWQFMPRDRIRIDGFIVQYNLYNNDTSFLEQTINDNSVRSIVLSGLETDTSYSIKMVSYNAAGRSDYSNTAVKKTFGASLVDGEDPEPSDDTPIPRPATPSSTYRPATTTLSRSVSRSQQQNDLLFIMLGVVLGVVGVVSVIVVTVCCWRQRQQRLILAAQSTSNKDYQQKSIAESMDYPVSVVRNRPGQYGVDIDKISRNMSNYGHQLPDSTDYNSSLAYRQPHPVKNGLLANQQLSILYNLETSSPTPSPSILTFPKAPPASGCNSVCASDNNVSVDSQLEWSSADLPSLRSRGTPNVCTCSLQQAPKSQQPVKMLRRFSSCSCPQMAAQSLLSTRADERVLAGHGSRKSADRSNSFHTDQSSSEIACLNRPMCSDHRCKLDTNDSGVYDERTSCPGHSSLSNSCSADSTNLQYPTVSSCLTRGENVS